VSLFSFLHTKPLKKRLLRQRLSYLFSLNEIKSCFELNIKSGYRLCQKRYSTCGTSFPRYEGLYQEESSEISQACLANGPAHQFMEHFSFHFHHWSSLSVTRKQRPVTATSRSIPSSLVAVFCFLAAFLIVSLIIPWDAPI
jgi:hypothetical protein